MDPDLKTKMYCAMRDLFVRDGPGEGTARALSAAFDLLKESNFGQVEASIVVDERLDKDASQGTIPAQTTETVVGLTKQMLDNSGEIDFLVRKDAIGDTLRIVSFRPKNN